MNEYRVTIRVSVFVEADDAKEAAEQALLEILHYEEPEVEAVELLD